MDVKFQRFSAFDESGRACREFARQRSYRTQLDAFACESTDRLATHSEAWRTTRGRDLTTLITGAAGFIGMHVAAALLGRGETVVGIDNFTPYYSVNLKHARVAHLEARYGEPFTFIDVDFEIGRAHV